MNEFLSKLNDSNQKLDISFEEKINGLLYKARTINSFHSKSVIEFESKSKEADQFKDG